jgi:hypothetical protein
MSRSFGLFFALGLLALLAAPSAARAVAPPRAKTKTGLRVVATIYYAPGMPRYKGFTRPAGGLTVKIFPARGKKAVAVVKTDDKGVFVVALPAGKYRVETVAFEDNPGRRQARREGVEVKEGAVSEARLKFTYARR